jgi:hypothetical protein
VQPSAKAPAPKGLHGPYRAAALCSDVWQRWKRNSFKPVAKAYLVAISTVISEGIGGGVRCLWSSNFTVVVPLRERERSSHTPSPANGLYYPSTPQTCPKLLQLIGERSQQSASPSLPHQQPLLPLECANSSPLHLLNSAISFRHVSTRGIPPSPGEDLCIDAHRFPTTHSPDRDCSGGQGRGSGPKWIHEGVE